MAAAKYVRGPYGRRKNKAIANKTSKVSDGAKYNGTITITHLRPRRGPNSHTRDAVTAILCIFSLFPFGFAAKDLQLALARHDITLVQIQ